MAKDKEVEKLGSFNVHVSLLYLDGKTAEYDCKSWIHNGASLALDLAPDHLKVVNFLSLKSFDVTPQKGYH